MTTFAYKPDYQRIDGILFPPFPPDNIRDALTYKPKPEDVFIATYPKCGTTWMQNIALYIFRKGLALEDPNEFHTYTPFIECRGMKSIENMPRPGALKTHLPYTHVPYSPYAKYIYVLRNPKDCCVSLYYHTVSGLQARNHPYGDATFDDFFEIFMSGDVEYNDYFDHLMSWYPHRNDKQVFFTTYEEMKKDTKDVVLRVASFLGKGYINAIENDNNILNNILRFSGFDYMKEHLSNAFKHHPKDKKREHLEDTESAEQANGIEGTECNHEIPRKTRVGHIRKGIVGDWKNHFSGEQNERMNKKFTEKTQGTDIYDMFSPYMFA